MIRFLLLLIIFALGLAAALVTQGTLYHLRWAFPGQLPDWTEGLPDDTGLQAGAIPVKASAFLPPLELAWRARMPGRDGLRWDIRLIGDGVDLAGVLVLAYWPDRATIDDMQGAVDMGAMRIPMADPGGFLSIQSGQIDATEILETPVFTATLVGDMREVAVASADFGQGPVTGTLAADGGWHLDVSLTGGVSPATATLTGNLPDRNGMLDLAIEDVQRVPDTLRGVLGSVGQPSGQGWTINAEVPIF